MVRAQRRDFRQRQDDVVPQRQQLGERLNADTEAWHGVLACVACHGPKALGNAVIPGLTGQHEAFLAVQLGAFASNSRDNAAMHLIAKGMTREKVKALTAYLASL